VQICGKNVQICSTKNLWQICIYPLKNKPGLIKIDKFEKSYELKCAQFSNLTLLFLTFFKLYQFVNPGFISPNFCRLLIQDYR
jgi:hypothetical protein